MNAFDNLTTREKHILLFISEGLTNRMIAEKLAYNHGTIRNIVSVILAKLQCRNRAALASYVARQRLEVRFSLPDLARHDPLMRSGERGGCSKPPNEAY